MKKPPKKLKLHRETLHALEAKLAQGGTVYTTQPHSCARTCPLQSETCASCVSVCDWC